MISTLTLCLFNIFHSLYSAAIDSAFLLVSFRTCSLMIQDCGTIRRRQLVKNTSRPTVQYACCYAEICVCVYLKRCTHIRLSLELVHGARTYDFSLMWNFRFSARTIWHFLYVRGRECVRPRSTTTDHLSPTALVHTAPPRHSRPVTANRPPSQPPSSPPQPPYALRLKNYEKHARETRLEDVCTRTFIYE